MAENAEFPKAAFEGPAPDLLLQPKRKETVEEFWPHHEAKFTVAKLKPADLAAFVRDACENRIYLMTQAPPHMVRMIFLPVALGAFAGWPREKVEEIGMIYEYWDKAMNSSINGQPIFSSMRLLHADDWEKAHKAIVRALERRKAAEKALEGELGGD